MANNLRIIYQNLVDSATIAATSTQGVLVPSNMQSDIKSLVWQTLPRGVSATTRATLRLAIPVITIPSGTKLGVIACFTNMSYLATMRVRFWSSIPSISTGATPSNITGGTQLYDSGTILCNQYQNIGYSSWDYDIYNPQDFSSTEYRNRKMYSRVWIPELVSAITGCTYITIEFFDTDGVMINEYFEVSRLIIGPYWSPKYNTSFDLESGLVDLSTSVRSEAGDLFTSNAPSYNTLNFDLKYMDKSDRTELNKLLKTIGTKKPLFVSLFPDSTQDWDLEQQYQIYGKLSSITGISHPMSTIYSSSVEIEEI